MLTSQLLLHGPSRFHAAGIVDADHARRAEVEAFVARVYAQRYGARLRSFLPWLLAFRDAGGELQAVVGLRRGQDGPLFVEQYLERPAEAAIRARLGRVAERGRLVEVGGFASRTPGDARELIVQLTHLLHVAGMDWVLFAATRQLRNAFDRMQLATVVLADARHERLQADDTHWGSYYASQPQVLCGDVAAGHAFLRRGRGDARREAAVLACAGAER